MLLFIVRASTATVNGWMGKRTLQSNNNRLRIMTPAEERGA